MVEPDWERHTKGIGSKLLAKFGFKGRLGAREDGVSASIEVVVRPGAAGLGYGDIVEASALKSNKKLEAEWRGLEYKEEEVSVEVASGGRQGGRNKRKGDAAMEGVRASQSWKKGRQKERARVLTAADFLAATGEPSYAEGGAGAAYSIVDMRGAEARVITDLTGLGGAAVQGGAYTPGPGASAVDREVAEKLGEELMLNASTIVDMALAEVEEQSRALKHAERRLQQLRLSRENLAVSMAADDAKRLQLDRLSSVLTRVHEGVASQAVVLADILGLFRTLHSNFKQEFHLFGLLSLLPSLAAPAVDCQLLQPLLADPLADSCALEGAAAPWEDLAAYFSASGEHAIAQQTMDILHEIFKSRALPAITRAVTNDWVPAAGGGCADLLQRLQPLCSRDTHQYLLEGVVLPRLRTAVSAWDPTLGAAVHTWLLPWLPLLKNSLSIVFPDIRRKLSQFLQRWRPEDPAALLLIRPWQGVFDAASLDALLLRSVLPRLLALLRGAAIDAAAQDLAPFESVAAWAGVLPDGHLVALFTGEVFPRWLAVRSSSDTVATTYICPSIA